MNHKKNPIKQGLFCIVPCADNRPFLACIQRGDVVKGRNRTCEESVEKVLGARSRNAVRSRDRLVSVFAPRERGEEGDPSCKLGGEEGQPDFVNDSPVAPLLSHRERGGPLSSPLSRGARTIHRPVATVSKEAGHDPASCRSGTMLLLAYEQPLVPPQVSHFRQVPLRTMVKLPHSEQLSPS